ncbi:hypothetical protein BDL97_11G116900 [Sphagnum fallax]|nr:hypothetical protein BDL97_11G116900 [Sphagnum fallax]
MMGHKKKGLESSSMKAQMEVGNSDKEEEQELHHDSEYTSWEEIVQSNVEEEDVEEWSMEEGVNEFMATEQVDEETLNLATGFCSSDLWEDDPKTQLIVFWRRELNNAQDMVTVIRRLGEEKGL